MVADIDPPPLLPFQNLWIPPCDLPNILLTISLKVRKFVSVVSGALGILITAENKQHICILR